MKTGRTLWSLTSAIVLWLTKITKGASKTLCYCTLGNLKRKFTIGLDRPVDVVMEKTILAGDRECRFRIPI